MGIKKNAPTVEETATAGAPGVTQETLQPGKLQRVQSTPPAPEASTDPLAVFERLARDPQVDIAKLERIIELRKDIMRVQAKAAFEAAYAEMQPKFPSIPRAGKIIVKDVLRSRFARLGEDIHPRIKPVMAEYGFSLRHRTEWLEKGIIRIVGILSHREGWSEESTFEAPSDHSDFRSPVQSQKSTVTYGRRVTTIDLLNLTERGVDDDGAATMPDNKKKAPADPKKPAPPAPIQNGDAVIGDAPLRKLAQVFKDSGRGQREVVAWLAVRFNYNTMREVKVKHFDTIVSALEKPGPLPLDREPGEDG